MKPNDLIVVLFDINYKDPFSILCSIVTACSYSHSAVHINDTTYDNTFLRGHFDKVDIVKEHPKDRELTLIRIKGVTGEEWLSEVKSSDKYPLKYDVLGLLLWGFGKHVQDREYCFETVNSCLSYYNQGIERKKGRISGKYIFNKFINYPDTLIMRTNAKNFNKNVEILRNI